MRDLVMADYLRERGPANTAAPGEVRGAARCVCVFVCADWCLVRVLVYVRIVLIRYARNLSGVS